MLMSQTTITLIITGGITSNVTYETHFSTYNNLRSLGSICSCFTDVHNWYWYHKRLSMLRSTRRCILSYTGNHLCYALLELNCICLGFLSCVTSCCIIGRLVPVILKKRTAIWEEWPLGPWKMKAVCTFIFQGPRGHWCHWNFSLT